MKYKKIKYIIIVMLFFRNFWNLNCLIDIIEFVELFKLIFSCEFIFELFLVKFEDL